MPIDKTKIKETVKNLDKLPPAQRLSALCSSVDETVEKLRHELTNEAIEDSKLLFTDTNPIPCKCGHNMHYIEDRKKKLFIPNKK
jgi:hypothetical protein